MKVQYRNFSTIRPFGVEGEYADCGINRNDIAKIIKTRDTNHTVKVTGWDNSDGSCWHVKTDSTCGWEVASYKGSGVSDLLNISNCFEAIALGGGFITPECGLHIHVDVSDFSEGEVARVVAHWMRSESVIFASVPNHRRCNIFCKMLRRRHIKKIGKISFPWKDLDFYQKIRPCDYNSKRDRRVSLNICNFEKSIAEPEFNRKTLEFRLPEMTSKADDVKNWIRLFVVFVENSRTVSIPCDMSSLSVPRVLYLFGLHGGEGESLILSDGLFRTKEWFLHRLLKYSKNKKLCDDAVTILNNMWNPLRKYGFNEKSGVFTEIV